MPLLLMLWCNVVKQNWTIIFMQTVLMIILAFQHREYGLKGVPKSMIRLFPFDLKILNF